MTVVVTGDDLTLDEVVRVARDHEPAELSPDALARMEAARTVVEHVLERNVPVYGMTTGVGVRKRIRVSPDDAGTFNRMLVLNHRVGQGELASDEVGRATLLRLVNGLAKGAAGVRPELAELVLRALNDGSLPRMRTLGSVGESDLPQMADAAHDLVGHGVLAPKEGIALVNNSAFSTGSAALAVADCARLLDVADVAGALDLEAFAANLTMLHPAIAELRPYPGLRETLARLRELLAGSSLWEEGAARNLQDPLTFRCLPQVHGAARDALAFVTRQVEIELNASQDNPIVVTAEDRIVSVGNFDVLPLAAGLDFLRVALAPVVTSATERLLKLLQSPFTDLPVGLAVRDGLAEDSLSEFGVAAQSLAAEARLLAQPVSFELASSTHAEGIEDRMTMASLSARRLAQMVELAERLVAIELVIAAQAVELRNPPALGTGTRRALELVRERIPFTGLGQALPQDLEPLVALVRSGALRLA
ncbi:MAG TPA: aromatic amino acid ammonia-lyase [Gaiellaceae bacterium]|nr:aromatic amino acid ammonia-lyase [Gaiellaceae bacterium]